MKQFLMKQFLSLIITGAVSLATSATSPTVGDWNGTLKVGPVSLSIVFHISENHDGSFKATMDSPDQGAKDIEAKIKVVGEDSVIIRIPDIGFKYNGKVTGDNMNGKMVQLGQRFQLDMVRGEPEAPNRPQTPKNLTYTTEEVTFESLAEQPATLCGTLSYPEGYSEKAKKKPTAIVMVTGSGLQDRDETVFDHKPFAVIADKFARNGIATLRYDDRGVGKSTGDNSSATTLTNAADAEGAIKYLKDTGKFSKVGVLGHSEGGSIAFIEGAKGNADFIIAIGVPAFKGDSIVTAQVNRALADNGSSEKISVADYRGKLKAQIDGNPWLAYFIDYDPEQDIRSTKIPVMALWGESDVQVPASTNLPRIEQLLPENNKNMVKSYPGLNHLMQPAKTGQVTEYREIETTISEDVLGDMVDWINAL